VTAYLIQVLTKSLSYTIRGRAHHDGLPATAYRGLGWLSLWNTTKKNRAREDTATNFLMIWKVKVTTTFCIVSQPWSFGVLIGSGEHLTRQDEEPSIAIALNGVQNLRAPTKLVANVSSKFHRPALRTASVILSFGISSLEIGVHDDGHVVVTTKYVHQIPLL
jgi:hypothetical protein